LRAYLVLGECRAKTWIVASASVGEGVLPAVSGFSCCGPFAIDDLLAGFDRARETTFGGVVQSLPFEALAYAETDLM
jgi:hypothetical protein